MAGAGITGDSTDLAKVAAGFCLPLIPKLPIRILRGLMLISRALGTAQI